jgi:SAM-dependent methyltransferase
MLADEVAHYLQETTRILKPGGICLFSCFLHDERHDAGRSKSQGLIDFSYRQGDAWIHNQTEPCVAVAYARSDMKRMIAAAGLCLENIIDGHWNDPHPKSAQQYTKTSFWLGGGERYSLRDARLVEVLRNSWMRLPARHYGQTMSDRHCDRSRA